MLVFVIRALELFLFFRVIGFRVGGYVVWFSLCVLLVWGLGRECGVFLFFVVVFGDCFIN